MTLAISFVLAPRPANALDWQSLWLNDDQRAAQKMEQEDYTAAAETFNDQRWRAAAWYRAGEYEKAAAAWAGRDNVEAHYNRGNALARSGRLHEAAAAYETVLKRDPDHADARHNLEVIKEMMQGSENQQQQQEQQNDESRENERQQEQGEQENRQGEQEQEQRQQQSGSDRSGEQRQQSRSERGQTEQQEHRQEPDRVSRQQAERQESSDGQQPEEKEGRPRRTGELEDDSRQPEQRAATEQWLRRIPDDPGGLLRRKFRYQYGQRQRGDEAVEEPW